MKEYEDEALDLRLKIHGQYSTIEYNDMNDKFYDHLEEINLSLEEFDEAFDIVGEYFSEGYEGEVKEEVDNQFVKDVARDMLRIIEIANMIKNKK